MDTEKNGSRFGNGMNNISLPFFVQRSRGSSEFYLFPPRRIRLCGKNSLYLSGISNSRPVPKRVITVEFRIAGSGSFGLNGCAEFQFHDRFRLW